MQNLLLATAGLMVAAAIPIAPAEAQSRSSSGFSVSSGGSFHGDFRRDRRDRRRHRDFDGDVFIGDWPRQGDSLWRADSFNDWWHEAPHRAYPAWVQRNQNCERMWWSGGGWRC